jgi:hypothetical protein
MKHRLAPVVAVAALLLGACGGGDDASPDEFRSQANKVCRDIEQQVDKIQQTLPATADQAEKQADAIVDVSDQALSNLRKIDAPEDLQPAYDRYLEQREKAIEFVEEAREAAADKDSAAYARAKRQLAAGQPTRRQIALRLGLGSCSRPSVPR